jgi:hypothetical protein
MKTSRVRSFGRSFPVSRSIRSAAMLAMLAGGSSGQAAIVTFNPTCAPFNWSSTCTVFNACGAGNTQNINSNNWGSSVCGAGSVFPGAADQVVFAGNGTIDIAPQVQRITVNPGVVVAFGVGFNATDASVGLLNNGTLNGLAGTHNWTGIFQNNGTFTEDSSGWTRSWNSVAFANAGTINLPGGSIWNVSGGSNSFSNLASGTINKTAGGTFSTNVALTNSGSINVTGGTFRVQSNQYQGNGGTITTSGAGEFLFENATLALGINGTSNSSIRTSGTLTIAGGPGATLNIGGNGLALNSNLALNGFLTNSNRVATLAGNQTWGGGTLTNNGIWTEDSAGWTRSWNSFIFSNNGTINLPGGVNWSSGSGSNVLDNNGIINKTGGGTFTANVEVRNNSTGTIALAASGGTFRVNGSYAGSGQLLPQSGSEVLFNGTFFDGNSGAVTGSVAPGGSIRTTGTITSPGVGATFNIQGEGISFNGNFGGGTSFRNNGIARTLAGNQTWTTNNLTNNGTWSEDAAGWTRLLVNTQFVNNGTLNLPGGVNWNVSSGSPSLANAGTINKTSGGTFSTNFGVTNTGFIDVASGSFNAGGLSQSAPNARTLVRSGAILGGGSHTLAGGRLEGRGSITTNFTTSGATVAPGESPSLNGTLTFNGTYTQSASGIYEVSLFGRPAQPSDRIFSNSNMSLAGALRVVITAPFLPKLGDVYEIARTNGTRTGTFSSVQVIGPSAVTVSVSYTPTTVLLTITGTECGSIDFNNDGSFFDPQDIDAFLSVFSEGPCVPGTATCNDIDFNNDAALFDPCDIDSFLIVFSEGPCTLCGV